MLIIFGSVRLIIAGPVTATGLDADDFTIVFFATRLVAALATPADIVFPALAGVFNVALVMVLAFILKPFMPWGSYALTFRRSLRKSSNCSVE